MHINRILQLAGVQEAQQVASPDEEDRLDDARRQRESHTITEDNKRDPDQAFEEYDKKYPRVGRLVDGREVRDDVPNTSSVSASLTDYEELPGIREVPMSEFGGPNTFVHSVRGVNRAKELAQQIQYSREIAPVIVVIDAEGPYILEGAHRMAALCYLQAKSVPALVIIDYDWVDNDA